MTIRPSKPIVRLLVILLYYIISGCASTPLVINSPQDQPIPAETSETGWWYARFRLHWPKDAEPTWHIDALLAHDIVSPILDTYRDQVKLWRFHRRAARDGGGHQFSFIFYSSPNSTAKIYRAIESHETLKGLMADGTVERLIFDNTQKIEKPEIQDTSDPAWNEIIQKSWPLYIMGVSEMWLDMIKRLIVYNADKSEPRKQLFQHVHEGITKLWEHEGNHAFFHHLNALFAYKSILVTERRPMRF